ncbi:hypothetical protein H6F93_26810 [Leptolyngbya sp. FACHB-671]|uniref:hypothetical protein n=1 Tax=Leptolyngbya sp. FACHB-671 TaxID=2692812 RepID=UPI0016866BDA|nr:hypothetical protein [Cyanobacteria bacterium FACHB-471]MBD2071082.1 hypothetical protein [Leptolyngbya sp. FACHB-671]
MVAIALNFGFALLVLLVFGLLQWLHIPTGSFLDWIIGIAVFEWLLVIVTVPWNVHFDAKEVLAEADQSEEKGIEVNVKQVEYAAKVAQASLWVAIALHLISAVGLYTLAANGISAIGYIGSGAALLLTVLRPAARTYQYLAMRLTMIRQQIKYPREDVLELRACVFTLEETIKRLEEQLNPNESTSWVSTQQRDLEATRQQCIRLDAQLRELQATNQAEHERIMREAKGAIAQLSTDGQFLEHVREIIRFFKTA